MKKWVVILVVVLTGLSSISCSRQLFDLKDLSGRWKVVLTLDSGKSEERIFHFVGENNVGIVLYKEQEVGSWIVSFDKSCQFSAIYKEGEMYYKEAYMGHAESESKISGQVVKTESWGYDEERAYSGRFVGVKQ